MRREERAARERGIFGAFGVPERGGGRKEGGRREGEGVRWVEGEKGGGRREEQGIGGGEGWEERGASEERGGERETEGRTSGWSPPRCPPSSEGRLP
jgi:hypothetical protein